MELHFTPEWEAKLNEFATTTGRPAGTLVQVAIVGYFEELAQVRSSLDSRYDEIKSGRVKAIDGKEAFERLRRKSHERRTSQS